MKIKKITSILMLTVMFGSILTSCADKQAKKSGTTELLWYVVGSPQKDMQLVNDEVNKQLEEKANLKVTIKMLDWNTYEQKMNMIISTKEKFDMCWTSPQTNNYYSNITKNAFMPLDDLLSKYAPQTRSKVSDELWDATRVDGKIYGAINYQIMATAYGYGVQRPIEKASGISFKDINSYNDLDDMLAFIKENYPDKIPLSYNNNQEPFTSCLPMFGMEAVGDNQMPGAYVRGTGEYKVVNQYETEEFKKYITKMHEYYKKGYLKSDASTSSEYQADLSAGKFGVIFPMYLSGEDHTMSDRTPDAPYSSTGIPYYQKKFTPDYITTDRVTATLTAISSTSEHPEDAMRLIETLNTDENIYNMLCFGIENKHYKKVEPHININGANVTIERIDNSGYAPRTNWMFGNTEQEWKMENDGPAEGWKKMNAEAVRSEILGFVFNTDPVVNEISVCSNILSEYITSLTSGSAEPTKRYEEFIAKLKTAGADKIVAEKQKQLDEWVKSKAK